MSNPLLRDELVDFLLYDVFRAQELTALPRFAAHDRGSFELVLGAARRVAREVLYPAYKPLDQEPPRFEEGRVFVHPRMHEAYPALAALGLPVANRDESLGGQQLPLLVTTMATAYLMAGNLSAYGYVGLSTGAAHLLESFGSAELQERYMRPLHEGRWLGTMALTEPQAGSSLADVRALATPAPDGSYRLAGAKLFISGGDHDLTENIVHLALARLPDAPPGTRGVSLFCVPKKRLEGDKLVDNDVVITGLLHKSGWRGLPSVALSFGDRGDCHGWLVGAPHRGLPCMFQMMNEARLMVGLNGVATASVAYLEALAYAETRTQGRAASNRDARTPPVALVEHADVRRMLLRQKAIVEGGLTLLARCARYADLAAHAAEPSERERAQLLLDLLTPAAKSFPAEWGFESNALAVQVHGGYGYTSEYPVEAWLRDQKLNSIHEGTTGVQGLDLLGRKAVAGGGAALLALREECASTLARARSVGLPERWCADFEEALGAVERTTMHLGGVGAGGDVEAMLAHSTDYLLLFCVVAVAWQHLELAAAGRATEPRDELLARARRGRERAAQYWLCAELPRAQHLARLCLEGEDSYLRARAEEL